MSFRLARCVRSSRSLKCHFRLEYSLSTVAAQVRPPPRRFNPKPSSPSLYASSPAPYKNTRLIPTTHAGRLRIELAGCANNGDAIRAFQLCKEMKETGIRPDIVSYKHFLHACSKQYLGEECLSLLEDMPNLGLAPDLETFNIVLSAQLFNENFSIEGLLDAMRRVRIVPNTNTYYWIIRHYANFHNLEMCMQSFTDMNHHGITIDLKTVQILIDLAASLGHARLALEVAYAFESTSPRSLQASDWMNILSASTAMYFEEGTLAAWEQLKQHHITPDEGQCIEVLNTAGRHGLVEIGVDALQTLQKLQVPFQEYHFAPLLEAYCRHNMLREAFGVLDLMHSTHVEFSQDTLWPLVNCMKKDVDRIHEAWSLLEEAHGSGKNVDIHSINTVLLATVHANDLQQSIGIYKAISNLESKANIETINILLTGCINFKHRELGEKVLSDMRQLGLTPNAITFERIIRLCLTGKPYEEAFFYLEEMKALGFKPLRSIYVSLIRKCAYFNDERWKIAYDEMQECGYKVDTELQKFIDHKGKAREGYWDKSPPVGEPGAQEDSWVEVDPNSSKRANDNGVENVE